MKLARTGAASKVGLVVAALACLLAARLACGDSRWGWALDAVVALAAAAGAGAASRLAKKQRSVRAWRLQMLVPLVWAIAPGVWFLNGPELLADIARLAAIGCAAGAWWLVSYAVDTWSRVRLVIDGGLAAGSFFVVGWDPVFSHAWRDSGAGPHGVLTIAAPLAAVWAATFLVGLMLTEMHGSHRAMPALFVMALLVTVSSDVLQADGRTPVWAVGWALAYVAVYTYRGTSGRREVFSTARIVAMVPYLVIAPAGVTFVVQGTLGSVAMAEIRAGLLMGAFLLVRQHVTLAENRLLVQRLAHTERLLRHQATHDHLTGLAGRVVLWERLEAVSEVAIDNSTEVAVIFVDLDGFKAVNDAHGHAAGDHVLIETARRLRHSLEPWGEQALVVRVSGDEFAVLLDADAAAAPQQTARGLLEAIREPMDVNGKTLSIGASFGVASATTGALNPSSLLRAADAAMYRVKHSGKGGVGIARGNSARAPQ